jgi:Tfp pilus assembly protein PilO
MKTSFLQGNGNWLLPLAALGLGAAYFALVFLPNRRAIGELAEQVACKQEAVLRAAEESHALSTTQKEIQRASAYVAAWQSASPHEANLASLFGRIGVLARSSHVWTTRLAPQEPLVMARVRRVSVLMGCTGSFSQITSFLQRLENMPQTLWINDLRLENSSKDGELMKCEMTLEVFADNPENSGEIRSSGKPI